MDLQFDVYGIHKNLSGIISTVGLIALDTDRKKTLRLFQTERMIKNTSATNLFRNVKASPKQWILSRQLGIDEKSKIYIFNIDKISLNNNIIIPKEEK